jgi:peroxiredoxin
MKILFFFLVFAFGINSSIFAQSDTTKMFNLELLFYDNMQVGMAAPDFSCVNLKGDSLVLSKLRDTLVVLNFFFKDCPPCVSEIPMLNKIYDKYSKQPVKFIAISPHDSKEVLIKFEKKYNFKFALVPSPLIKVGIKKTSTRIIAERYFIGIYPTTVVIDGKGIIAYVNTAISSEEDLLGIDYILKKLLSANYHK